MPTRRTTVALLALLITVASVGACQAAKSGADDAARQAAILVEKMGWTKSSTNAAEDWLKVTKNRTGLTLEEIVSKADGLRPAVVLTPPIRSSADLFVTLHFVPSQHRQLVRDVFIGTMCDTASAIARGKAVDAAAIVESAIKSSAGTLSQSIELAILRDELQTKVREFARAKSAQERDAVTTDMSSTLECFFLGKVVT